MKRTVQLVVVCVAAMFTMGQVQAGVSTIKAFDTANPDVSSGEDIQDDNILRAFYNASFQVDGFMGFNLSAIPDNVNIDSLTLTLYGDGLFSTPVGNPELRIYRSNFDGWVRGGIGFPNILDEALTPVDTGPFPSGDGVAYSFSLDTAAVNWETDLLDNQLTLVLRTEKTDEFNYAYWYGSDNPLNAPSLTIEYSENTPNLVPTPEPTSLAIFGIGALCMGAGAARRRRREKLATEA